MARQSLRFQMIAIIYLLEAGLFCAALGAYKSAALPPQWNSVAGATMLVGIGVASAAILVLIVLFMRGRPGSARAMVVAIGANLITVSISFVVAEGLLHMIATPGVTGVKIGAVDLLKNGWLVTLILEQSGCVRILGKIELQATILLPDQVGDGFIHAIVWMDQKRLVGVTRPTEPALN